MCWSDVRAKPTSFFGRRFLGRIWPNKNNRRDVLDSAFRESIPTRFERRPLALLATNQKTREATRNMPAPLAAFLPASIGHWPRVPALLASYESTVQSEGSCQIPNIAGQ